MSNPHELVLGRLEGIQTRGQGQWRARCPAHEDDQPSLEIGTGRDGRALVTCRAGCDVELVLEAIGLRMAHLFPPKEHPRSRGNLGEIVATYDYVGADGGLLYQVVRFHPKKFRQRRRARPGDPSDKVKDGWVWSLKGVERTLYRLPQVWQAIRDGRRLYVVEGEKDADRLWREGLPATTCAMGAGKWFSRNRDNYSHLLQGAPDVVVLPDNDKSGREHAHRVATALLVPAHAVRVLELDVGPKGDVSDWLDAGNTAGDLDHRADLQPLWAPPGAGGNGAAPPEQHAPAGPGPNRIVEPLDAWGVIDGRLVKWVGAGEKAAAHSMFRGVPELARVTRSRSEDPEQRNGWREDEELVYRFRLPGGRTLERRAEVGAAAFQKLLSSSELEGATHAITQGDRARLYLWALERSPDRVCEDEVRAVGPHEELGWLAPPRVAVREGIVEEPEFAVAPPVEATEFRRYRLANVSTRRFRDTARWVVDELFNCDHADGRYVLPLVGAFQAAPLWTYLEPLSSWQRAVFFVVGPSGVGKSQLCRYVWSFWGDFVQGDGLTTWLSTATYLEDLLHHAVGVPVFVADWKRAHFSPDAYRSAMALVQAYADRSSRGRASRGRSAVERKRPPRCTWIVDGEDLPEGEQSTLGRLIVLRVAPHGPTGRCATASSRSLDPKRVADLPGVTARWIAWVQRNATDLSAELFRAEALLDREIQRRAGVTNRSRLVRAYAVQDLATRSFIRFLDEEGSLGGLHELANRAQGYHLAMAAEQLGVVQAESAGEQFVAGLVALLRAGEVYLEKETQYSGEEPFGDPLNSARRVGTYHDGVAKVWSDVALPLVNRHLSQGGGRRIEFTASAILQQLRDTNVVTGTPYQRVGNKGHPAGRPRVKAWVIPLHELGADDDRGDMFQDGDEED